VKKNIASILLFAALASATKADVMIYPASGNIDARAGTIEFWIRLEAEPDGGKTSFPFFLIGDVERHAPIIRFTYQPIWNAKNYHLFFSTVGMLNGEYAANPYVATVDETMAESKGDYGSTIYPRTPRFHKGDWHHIAITWQGLPQATVAIYCDGALVFRPLELQVPLWARLDDDKFILTASPYHDAWTMDELHISGIARTPEEIKASFERRRAEPDRFTLLLDDFENVEKDDTGALITHPRVITHTPDGIGGREQRRTCLELVDGINGRGLKTLAIYKK